MARTPLAPEEKEKRKLERRAAKKARRAQVKAAVEVIEQPTSKKGKNKNPFQLIEVTMGDHAGHVKIGQLREAGIPVVQMAYSTGYFIYKVPSTVTGFAKYGTGPIISDENVPEEKPLKSIADLVTKVTVDKEDGRKMNKRYIKLLVRGSELKRNLRKEAVDTLIKQFKIK